MKAAVLQEAYKIEYLEVPAPQPADGEVQIRISYTGICGSELYAYRGLHKRRVPPIIMGHEISGVVSALGKGAGRFQTGDRVTVVPMYGCGTCPACLRGETSLCSEKTILGSREWPGGFAEYCTAPEKLVYQLPKTVSMEDGALVEPLAVGLHAVRTAKITTGEKAAVLGSGTIGLCTAMMAARAGAVPLICTDIQKYNLEKARTMGATHTIDSSDPELVSKILEITEGGCDCVFIAAPIRQLIDQAIQITRIQGQIVCVAMFGEETPVNVELNRAKELTFTGISMYYEEDFARVLNLLRLGRIDAGSLVTRVMPLSDADVAFRMYMDRSRVLLKYF